MSSRRGGRFPSGLRRSLGLAIVSAELTGCGRSPSFDVLGSYFPGWLACLIIGVCAAALLHFILRRMKWERHLPLLPFLYLCVVLLIACTVWLVTFD